MSHYSDTFLADAVRRYKSGHRFADQALNNNCAVLIDYGVEFDSDKRRLLVAAKTCEDAGDMESAEFLRSVSDSLFS